MRRIVTQIVAPILLFILESDMTLVYLIISQVVAATDFISSKHNMAMSMHRETYLLIKQHHTVGKLSLTLG